MIAEPERIAEILDSATACLVTEEEHRRLNVLPPDTEGWDRYRAAGITVIDMATGRPLW